MVSTCLSVLGLQWLNMPFIFDWQLMAKRMNFVYYEQSAGICGYMVYSLAPWFLFFGIYHKLLQTFVFLLTYYTCNSFFIMVKKVCRAPWCEAKLELWSVCRITISNFSCITSNMSGVMFASFIACWLGTSVCQCWHSLLHQILFFVLVLM